MINGSLSQKQHRFPTRPRNRKRYILAVHIVHGPEASRGLALSTIGVAYLVRALADGSPAAMQKQRSRGDSLSERERKVAALIGQGASNRAIAETLVISERTVERHVANIFAKLNFGSRTQIAAFATESGMARHVR